MYELCHLPESAEKADEPPPAKCQNVSDSDEPGLIGHKNNNIWNDWKWQIANRIRDLAGLYELFPNLKNNDFLPTVIKKYPMAITPYYASLIRKLDISDPIFAMSIPQVRELAETACLSEDPLEENEDMPVPGLVHRYPDRALIIATTTCSMYCRHCTRKRVAGTTESTISQQRLRQVHEYLLTHPDIHDVIISGGDPLTMNTEAIERVLIALRSIPSVQVIRIGTRTPVVLPQRITDELVSMLKKYHPIWINTHFNHPNELTAQAAAACTKLADAGIPLGNQSVLLKGINDNPQTFEQLCRGLIRMRVRPYYLFQCDLVKGVEHFRTPLSRGIEIMEYLRGRLSGIAIPTFVVDAPHGGGKIPVLPNYIVSMSPTHTVLRNFEGMMVNYPEPSCAERPMEIPAGETAVKSVWDLASGRSSVIVPENTKRHQRRKTIVRKKNTSMVQEEFNF
ncbi:MAG: KamA family radical SAM protein [Phycisphaerae bacterium]|nr:KamA family radical SAM protein [Phycisphaerae bacterium]